MLKVQKNPFECDIMQNEVGRYNSNTYRPRLTLCLLSFVKLTYSVNLEILAVIIMITYPQEVVGYTQ